MVAWGLQRIGIDACWQQGLCGEGVRIGQLDTGVDGSHPALCGRIAEFMEFDGDGYPVHATAPRDSGSHGTHIAGVICGQPCNGLLSIGTAPGAELCSAMVIEGGKRPGTRPVRPGLDVGLQGASLMYLVGYSII